jgi:hypothetical protein
VVEVVGREQNAGVRLVQQRQDYVGVSLLAQSGGRAHGKRATEGCKISCLSVFAFVSLVS